MIKRIELKNFESHKHSVIEGLSERLTLICGISNSGKTAIVRAIKLVAYNDFDPSSVRTGCKNCEVTITTDKGAVRVTRGKDNIWDIRRRGVWFCTSCENIWNSMEKVDCPSCGNPEVSKTVTFKKIGKNAVPDLVGEVLGFGMIGLGDVEVPVNIMNQEESHFMLRGLGDKKASGSIRAQVVDEISGLSGIEGLIKSVSLDRHRQGTDIRENEERIEKIISEMHDEDGLKKERVILDKVQELKEERLECKEVKRDIEGVVLRAKEAVLSKKEIEEKLSEVPDTEKVERLIGMSDDNIHSLVSMADVYRRFFESDQSRERIEFEIDQMMDVDSAMGLLNGVDELFKEMDGKMMMLSGYRAIAGTGRAKKEELESIPDSDVVIGLLDEASIVIAKDSGMNNVLKSYNELISSIELKEEKLAACEVRLAEAIEERDAFDVCPLCDGSIESHECLTERS